MPPTTPTLTLTTRGQPTTSRGLRNASCIGTSLGNGGVTAPGTYERRRNIIDPEERHDAWWRRDWLLQLAEMYKARLISERAMTAGQLIATYSSDTGQPVFATQATIGGGGRQPIPGVFNDGKSASTINRGLAELRHAGALEWEHRFLAPDKGNPKVRATSNLYVFRFATTFCSTVASLTKRIERIAGVFKQRPGKKKGQRAQRPGRPDDARPAYVAAGEHLSAKEQKRRERQRMADSAVAAHLLTGASFAEIVAHIDDEWQDVREYAYAYLEERWKERTP
jgi:hypothetical protein